MTGAGSFFIAPRFADGFALEIFICKVIAHNVHATGQSVRYSFMMIINNRNSFHTGAARSGLGDTSFAVDIGEEKQLTAMPPASTSRQKGVR